MYVDLFSHPTSLTHILLSHPGSLTDIYIYATSVIMVLRIMDTVENKYIYAIRIFLTNTWRSNDEDITELYEGANSIIQSHADLFHSIVSDITATNLRERYYNVTEACTVNEGFNWG